jgi:uncharacterized protein
MTDRLLIADSSPLIGLARIGRLNLLVQLEWSVVCPTAVWREVTADDLPGAQQVLASRWIQVVEAEPSIVARWRPQLGVGEAEALALALAQPSSRLLIDDGRGRRIAAGAGVRVIGTLGVLRRAKIAGLIPCVAPEIARLHESGIYLSPSMVDRFLRELGEGRS